MTVFISSMKREFERSLEHYIKEELTIQMRGNGFGYELMFAMAVDELKSEICARVIEAKVEAEEGLRYEDQLQEYLCNRPNY